MRLAFWRKGESSEPRKASSADVTPTAKAKGKVAKAPKPKAPPKTDVKAVPAAVASANGDVDLRLITQALARKKHLIIGPTLLALVISLAAVNLITPRYKSEARILIDGRENVFLRPNGQRNDERNALDPEAVTSQVQLLLSRDLAREVIAKNKLAERPEFDPVLRGISPLKSLLALFGIGRDPFSMTPEERVLDAYFDRLTAYAVDKSRVVVVEFQSRDPKLAAQVANSIADGFLALQQAARQEQAKAAGQWLSGEIDSLRKKVDEAESRVEDFRSKSSLFIGTNNTSLSNQQLGELNTQLNNARALKSDAESKAQMIRGMLQSGRPIEASEVMNSELVRRLTEQRVTLSAQLAEQSSTLLDGHPRIKELKAQLANLDRQLRDEASKISRSLDNDARIAGSRVEGLSASLDRLKQQATSSNGDDVKLRALEREAKAQRDLLESYLAKYREATTRETIDAAPADGRIISRAIVSNTPAYPKKLPIVLIVTLATLMLTAGSIATGELLRMTQPRGRPLGDNAVALAPTPVVAAPPVAPEIEAELAAPALRDTHPELGAPVGEIEILAQQLRAEGDGARKVTVLGTGTTENVTLTALTLARLLARHAKVVLVDLSESSATLSAVAVDSTAPGLAELMQGEASFGQVITKDRMSSLHLVGAGRPGFDRSLLQSPRLTLALDALQRVYDLVLLDAGTAADLPAELLTAQARAVVVPDPAMQDEARNQMAEQLKAVGFSSVTMISKPSQPGDAGEPETRTVAA
ncbi:MULTISPECIES: exopolysaccharide transport family protein [Rhodopseudomonas]|uniref:Lipopolysaccharide biosynthesis protein n=1 Tax=Rhodopseudomonas palustris TaxID=1076 RepID=A0A0D7EIS4_RHOPL|nr:MULTISPECIES: exopolysaccharide transport family protein [Rhodopseudomonas]KIZ40556.1 lipopolysaccharide biosynthesis protein [Rhodopseudomonas palustris]MDF3808806.1 exopolysaccharide transport family protein [Rhodopseudomonas sp. BAL398]WOK19159.1 exopolysaccharide transport family protein [Rhodopseudomonas sp. BAL398]